MRRSVASMDSIVFVVNDREERVEAAGVAGFGGVETVVKGGHGGRGFALDVHMDEDEPLLIGACPEVLDQTDVAALDAAMGIETEIVVERVAAVAEDRGPSQGLGDGVPWNRKDPRQHSGRLRARPDIGMGEIAEKNHGALALTIVGDGVERKWRQVFDGLPKVIGDE